MYKLGSVVVTASGLAIERLIVRLPSAALPGSDSRQVVDTHASVRASGLVVEYRTRCGCVGLSRPSHLQANLNKLLTYCVLRPAQPPTLRGTGNE